MNYQNQLKKFLEDYAQSLIGDKDITVYINLSDELTLLASKGTETDELFCYDFETNQEVDESSGEDTPKFYLCSNAREHITSIKGSSANSQQIIEKISPIFQRYCRVMAANYVIYDTPFIVSSEILPNKENAVYMTQYSNEYRKLYLVDSIPFQIYVELISKDGVIIDSYLLESVEEK